MNNSKDNHSDGVEKRRQRKNVVPHNTTVRMLSVRKIASVYGFHENTVRRWVTEDGLMCVRYGPGNKIFISEQDVEDFIKQYYYYI